MLVLMTKDGAELSVHPSTVAEHQRLGWGVVSSVAETDPAVGDVELTDDELRAAIEAATGKAPHHKTGRAKLLEQYAAAQGGSAA
ncbi:hypothetical protein [Kaistia sp. MMO-174]|uniref:hypothetical protein n=1 Tax=Kaistia sp. MMO-174 TaxID=3081256 RepID=UPI00301843D7